MSQHLWLAGLVVLMSVAVSSAGEIGFIEEFSLAPDRSVPLKQLIPGTEEYYYYHSLYYQQTEQWDKVDETLEAWINRYKHTPRVYEILNRQMLLTYERNPEKSLAWLRDRLNLRFDHQRELLNRKPNLPTQLDADLIAPETLRKQAFSRRPNTLQGIEDAGLDDLVGVELTADQRRELLSRLTRPDYPNLPQLIVDDLNYKNSGGFGQFPIHNQLLLSQLEELLRLKPDLLNQSNFVTAYLSKLRPSHDVNWRQDPEALEAYFDRLWAFVGRLAPVHNSLKAHVLYHRLVFDRSRGIFNAERFLEYIKLPRNVVYIEPKYLQLEENRRHPADLQADYTAATSLPIIGTDEPLVRSYLQHFFLTADDYEKFEPYIRDEYLKHLFAETKIVNGLGDPEKWYSLLPPAQYQALKERIDLDFAFTNQTEFDPDEPVALDVYVKNVQTLIVKVFEINTQNYYRQNLAEVNTDINLDGLVANTEQTHHYDDPPLRRIRRHFEFPNIDDRGVYVIDFIGNGMSSRALIRKGKLRYLVRTTTAGQLFTIFDEQNRQLQDATLWLAGTLYHPADDGTILTPFSNQPGQQPIVLSHGGFSSLEFFHQESENYVLSAGIYVDREELLSRKTARLIVRPALTLNGTPVSLKPLEDVQLILTSHDLDDVATTKEVSEFRLFEDRESVFEFQVPQRLRSLQCTLKAKLEPLSQDEKIEFSVLQSFAVNEIDRMDKIEDLHLVHAGGTFAVELLGKTGEAQADHPVKLSLKHRDFREPVTVTLQTNAAGQVSLGRLPEILTVTATAPQGTSHTWTLPRDEHSYNQSVHAAEGQTVLIPYMGTAQQPQRTELSLIELRGETFVADRFDAITLEDGLLHISDLPPGDFSLLLKRSGTHIRIRIADGERRDGYVLGSYRRLEQLNPKPLQIEPVTVQDENIRIQLQNATPYARVHVFVTRFVPAFSAHDLLGSVPSAEPYWTAAPWPESLYVAGRNIGDEYRYILDRRFQRKYPGNMLERPSLLLNPWAIRSTETGEQLAEEGGDFGRGKGQSGGSGGRAPLKPHEATGASDYSNLDFLKQTSLVLTNLTADDRGVIVIPREDLGAHQDVTIVAVDPQNLVTRRVSLPARDVSYGDLRLVHILDVGQHYTQQKQISTVKSGGDLMIPDITSAQFEVYDSLARVYRLYATLNPEPHLLEFGFILEWPELEPDRKRELYSKYASHELHLFLARKDPEFFRNVIQPYLEHKKDKTFLDHYLLEDDLQDYLQPWHFARLNTVERILLARRLEGQRSSVERFVREQWELLPPDVPRFEHLFGTALEGSALDTGDALGIIQRQGEEKAKREMSNANGTLPQLAAPDGRRSAPGAPADQLKKMMEAESAERDAAAMNELRRRMSAKDDRKQDADYFFDELRANRRAAQYYRKLDQTREWAENNYYQRPIEQQDESLVKVNAFWKDFAAHDPDQPFYSSNFAEASRNFTEMLLALAVLDLPFTSGKHETEFDGPRMTFKADGPVIAFHQEIRPAREVADETPILVSQSFYRRDDRYRYENNVRQDKFVTAEFLVDVVYGCQIVVTNPTSAPQKLNLLLQIPQGAMPVLNSQYTKSVSIDLQPYHTQTAEYHFYFPAAGDYPHYPVQVASNEEVVAFADPFTFHVVNQPTNIDKQSWDFVSQHASDDEVLAFLKEHNIQRLNLDRIAFRMADEEFFRSVIALLADRHVYDHTLWSYGIKHGVVAAIRQYLQHADEFVAQTGDWLSSPLLTIDPVERRIYQHLDYKPLVNARVNQLGRNRQILNDRFFEQYHRLLKVLSYRPELDDEELMAVTYYMLLQDRIEEAQSFFERVDPNDLATRLQYDYFTAYLDFYRELPEHAHDVAVRYADHPVDRWRKAFSNVVAQAEEITSQMLRVVDTEERTQAQTAQADATPSFDFHVEAQQVTIRYQNLGEVRVNYYLMDVELLFSRNPFVQRQSQQFSYILPNTAQTVVLPDGKTAFTFPLPDELRSANVLVEIDGGGETKSQAYYAHAMAVQTVENYGQVRVTQGAVQKPLPKVYVKVYARMQDGTVRFYKDGYTDLRGRFDYTSLNTNELDFVDRFALLILSEDHGAVVAEANPPKR